MNHGIIAHDWHVPLPTTTVQSRRQTARSTLCSGKKVGHWSGSHPQFIVCNSQFGPSNIQSKSNGRGAPWRFLGKHRRRRDALQLLELELSCVRKETSVSSTMTAPVCFLFLVLEGWGPGCGCGGARSFEPSLPLPPPLLPMLTTIWMWVEPLQTTLSRIPTPHPSWWMLWFWQESPLWQGPCWSPEPCPDPEPDKPATTCKMSWMKLAAAEGGMTRKLYIDWIVTTPWKLGPKSAKDRPGTWCTYTCTCTCTAVLALS